MNRRVRSLVPHERGATAIEYALILALITIVMLVGFSEMAGTTTGLWGEVSNKVITAN